MKQKLLLSLALTSIVFLTSCMYAPKTLSELRSKPPSRVQMYNMSYQNLAECWQNFAKPTYLDWKRSSFLNIYNEKNYAVITTNFSLMEIKKVSKNKSEVVSYDGGMHKRNHADWFEVFDECASVSTN